MKTPKPTWIKGVCAAIGFGLSMPSGAIISNVAGGLLTVLLPGFGGFASAVLGQVAIHALRKGGETLGERLTSAQKVRINHDLQTAFRDSCRAALYDLGGERCFPQVWRGRPRDVPEAMVYPQTPQVDRLWREDDPLASQVKECFEGLLRALDEGRMLPLDPPPDQTAADVRRYLEAETPEALADAFYEAVLAPQLADYAALSAALPSLGAHLRRYTLDRLLVHLGEALKERDHAWRAYNRLMLEGVRDELRGLSEGQGEILARLEAFLSQPDGQPLGDWAGGLADLLAATGQIEKRLDEGLDAVLERVVAQHGEVVARLEGLLAVTLRIESKVDRVLRILEDGRYVIEGAPSRRPRRAAGPRRAALQGPAVLRSRPMPSCSSAANC